MKNLSIAMTLCCLMSACHSTDKTSLSDSITKGLIDTAKMSPDSAKMYKQKTSDKKVRDSLSNIAPASGIGDKVLDSTKKGK